MKRVTAVPTITCEEILPEANKELLALNAGRAPPGPRVGVVHRRSGAPPFASGDVSPTSLRRRCSSRSTPAAL
jgi:hypothetical protein